MANWGAFAGGLTKGYLAGEEMQQTQKRTALMADEVELRKQEAARRAEEAAWQKKNREAQDAYRRDYAAVLPTLPYAKDADGNIDYDPTNPANARANTMAYGHSYRLRVQYGLTTPKDDADFLTMQQELGAKDRQQAATQFILTGDATHLEKIDPAFKGAKIVVDKGPKGEAFEFLQMADGTKHSMDKIYAVLPGGKEILANKDRAIDNERQGRLVDAQIRNLDSDNARAAARFKEDQKAGKVADILAVKRYIKEGVIQKPEKDPLTGKMSEADPVWNDTAEAMLADRMKKYGTKKDDVTTAANEADDVQAEIRNSLREVDRRVAAQVAEKKITDQKVIKAAREHAFKTFRDNGFKLPELKKEPPPREFQPGEAKARIAAIPK